MIEKFIIRPMNITHDMDSIVELWYDVSIRCHDFIDNNFWGNSKNDMRNIYLPNAQTMVAEQNGKIVGFLSLYDKTVAALFVANDCQGQGIGAKLLEMACHKNNQLTLKVYKKNQSAKKFYEHHGFIVKSETTDTLTGEEEFVMEWERKINA